MQINWTRCSERMPPKSAAVIVKSSTDKAIACLGSELINHKNVLCRIKGTSEEFNSYDFKWTPFTVATWRGLNK